jgi:hypothetical protein
MGGWPPKHEGQYKTSEVRNVIKEWIAPVIRSLSSIPGELIVPGCKCSCLSGWEADGPKII